MRQVTGSNPMLSNKKVSIQLKLDGHSFSRDILPTDVGDKDVIEVELLTLKSTLVPAEFFEPELAEKYLWFAGIECSADERPVWSDTVDGVVAVMALRCDIVDILHELYGDCIKYSSPLLQTDDSDGRHLYIYNATDFAYFKLFDDRKLEFCEVLPTTSKDDVLCQVERIAEEFDLTKFVIRLAGDNCDEVLTLLKQYHKVEKCE